MPALIIALVLLVLAFLAPLVLHGAWWMLREHPSSWQTADWSSARLLPPAADAPRAVVLVLGAPAGRWKGIFAQHTWIVVKEAGATQYTRFDVVSWGRPVRVNGWAPDARWYGNAPHIIAAVHGEAAAGLIPRIRAAVADYPHGHEGDYRVWPGPNSNTFVAAVLARIPEAGIALPANALGKDFRDSWLFVGWSPSRTGIQVSAFGLLGLTIAWVEGMEVNLFGLVSGIDLRSLALKLPGWGTLPVLPSRASGCKEDVFESA